MKFLCSGHLPCSDKLDALYGPVIPYTLPASVHSTFVNAFKNAKRLKPLS